MEQQTTIQVGEATVDFDTLTIDGPNGPVSMEPKVMDLLRALVESAGSVVSRQSLLDTVWRDTHSGDESLSRGISLLRKAFAENRGSQRYIETVPKRGYRLVATVAPVAEPTALPARTPGLTLPAVMIAVLLLALLAWQLTRDTASGVDTAGDAIDAAQVSLAVLPFTDLSSEGDQQFLADGLAEEILNALVQFPDLHVSGRGSSFNFRDANPDLAEISATLGVTHVLSGSVRKQGDRVRITSRLVQASDGYSLWSDTYDGDLVNVFDLQEDIARKVAASLGVVLDLSSGRRFAPRLTDSREAYELFLQGRVLARLFGHRNKDRARDLLERAVGLDPTFAAAWAWLAQAHIYLTLTVSHADIPDHIDAARQALERALVLDPELAVGYYVKSILLDYELDFAASAAAHERAFELSPGQPLLAHRRGYSRMIIGRVKEGATLMEEALRWDPTDAIGLLNLGVAKRSLGELDAADQLFQRSKDLGFGPAIIQLCQSHLLRDDRAQALACWETIEEPVRRRFQPLLDSPLSWDVLGRAFLTADQEAGRLTVEALDRYLAQPGAHLNSYLLFVYLGAVQPERFMRAFLQHPYPLNAGALSGLWEDLPSSASVRRHPDFPAFAERVGLVAAWQAFGWPDQCQPREAGGENRNAFHCE